MSSVLAYFFFFYPFASGASFLLVSYVCVCFELSYGILEGYSTQ